MKYYRSFELAGSAVAAAILTWLLPEDWLLNVFLGTIAITLLFGVLAAASAKEEKPTSFGIGILTFLLIGTTRPKASVKDVLALRLFALSTAFLAGLVLSVLVAVRA